MSRLTAVLLAAGLGTATVIAHAAPAIVSASPQGEVAQVRQVTVKFSESVVAFGDPRLADPFAISCQGAAPAGAGRWASDRVWVYDFREALPPGTKCTREASPRVEAERRGERRGRGGAAHRAEGVRLFHRRPGDRRPCSRATARRSRKTSTS